MIFVKDSLSDVNKTQVNESGLQEDLELSKFLNQFQDVFIDDIPRELPPKRGDDDHAIELIPSSSPPNKPPYRVTQAQQEEIMRQVNELVEKGMVRPSSSPFRSPFLLVHKKNGTYRMCVDYRALNKITIKNRFLVPRIEDLFDKLQGSTYFSRIDLKSGYHQIRIVNEDILKIAFCTTFGLYEYLVMPFGLTNAPVTFNRMMERIFRPHRNVTGVFFDDVIIYSKSMEEHKKHLQPNWNIRFHVHVDASRVAMDAILAQPNGKADYPIYFAGRRFSKAEQGYSITEREALGMVFNATKFRHYLMGRLFYFYVDHQALLYLINKVIIQGRLIRWMMFLMKFDFKIFHKPGKSHCGADFLLRSIDGYEPESFQDEPVNAKLFQTAIAVEELDPEWLEVQDFLQNGKIPEDWSQSRKKGLIVKSLKFTIIGGSLYRLGIDGVLRRYVPISARMQIITEAHNGSSGGHFSSDITYKKILQAGLWWQSIMADVKTYCKTCDICQRMG
ncbi:hypothetical protein L7F22_039820 [Adiantum nelumboides]|nr:hypothetical protein [Adiantum nelumboides]